MCGRAATAAVRLALVGSSRTAVTDSGVDLG